MLVILAVVPLAAASLLASSLVRRDETAQVDGNLSSGVAGAFASYQTQLFKTRDKAVEFARSKPVQQALAGHGDPQTAAASIGRRWTAELVRQGHVIGGKAPPGPAWRVRVPISGGPAHSAVLVWLPITDPLLATLTKGYPRIPGVELAAVAGGRAFASTSGITGPATGITTSSAGNGSIGGHGVRAQAVTLPSSKGGPVLLASTYSSAAIDNAVDSRLLRLLAPLIVAALIVTALALFAAGRISQALTDLSGRAVSLLRPGTPPPAGRRARRTGRGDRSHVDGADHARGRAGGGARPRQGDAPAIRRDARCDPPPGRPGGCRAGHRRPGHPGPRRPAHAVRRRYRPGDRAGPDRQCPGLAHRPAHGRVGGRRPGGAGPGRDGAALGRPAAGGADGADRPRGHAAWAGHGRRP